LINSKDNDIKSVKDFIFNDNVQHILSSINDNLMDFNILEITGMGNQEIKHSNILGWLFDDSEHNLEYHILDNFLKKVIEENRKDTRHKSVLDNLQSYIYLSEKKKEITIYREKDNIDLLIVDEANKVIIIIENKVYASERTDGIDGGQLKKYEDSINQKYNDEYKKYFIFLTIDLEEPSSNKWIKANHKMITDVIEEILKTKIDITMKTIIILESYVDILKRNGIVADETLEILCKKIWDNPEYKKALETINNFKPDIFNDISVYLQEQLKGKSDVIELDDSTRTLIRFKSNSWDCDEQRKGNSWTTTKNVLLYEFQNSNSGLNLKLIIGPTENQDFRKEIFAIVSNEKKIFKPGNKLSEKWNQVLNRPFISKEDINNKSLEELKGIIDEKLKEFFAEDNDFEQNNAILNDVMKNKEENK